jgi:hypothetical protein
MIATLTGLGLSAAAGLNAYIPFLVVALVARFTDLITLPASFAWIETDWAIGIGLVLLLSEMTLDKIPAVDTVNDAVQTFIRPSMGGLIFAATSAASEIDSSTWMAEHPWVGVGLGVVVSGLVHTGKMAARPAINVGSAGTGGPVVSVVEDTASVGLSLVAILAPVLVLVALVLLVWALVALTRRVRRRRRRRAERAAARAMPRGPGETRQRDGTPPWDEADGAPGVARTRPIPQHESEPDRGW